MSALLSQKKKKNIYFNTFLEVETARGNPALA
jgi:hypothetical protein